MLIIIFEAYVTNLGKYNEGELLSEPLKFPAATEEVQAVLKRIGVEGLRYEEYFMAEYVSDPFSARISRNSSISAAFSIM